MVGVVQVRGNVVLYTWPTASRAKQARPQAAHQAITRAPYLLGDGTTLRAMTAVDEAQIREKLGLGPGAQIPEGPVPGANHRSLDRVRRFVMGQVRTPSDTADDVVSTRKVIPVI